jgi:ribosomal protein L9
VKQRKTEKEERKHKTKIIEEIPGQRWKWSREADLTLRIFGSDETVTTRMIIRTCWEKAGFTYQPKDVAFYLVA